LIILEFSHVDPSDRVGVVAGARLAGGVMAGEYDNHIVPLDPAVDIAADNLGPFDRLTDFYLEPGLLANLARSGIFEALPDLHDAAGKTPIGRERRPRPAHQQDAVSRSERYADGEHRTVGVVAKVS